MFRTHPPFILSRLQASVQSVSHLHSLMIIKTMMIGMTAAWHWHVVFSGMFPIQMCIIVRMHSLSPSVHVRPQVCVCE